MSSHRADTVGANHKNLGAKPSQPPRTPEGFRNPVQAPPTKPAWAGFFFRRRAQSPTTLEHRSLGRVVFFVSSDRIIVDALRLAHGLVWQNVRPTTDAATVSQLRDLIHSPSVRSALEHSSDTLPAFALREVARALSDQSQPHGETIARIRNVLDEPN
jgi:hypothetical protein